MPPVAPVRRRRILTTVLTAALVLAGCNDDGRTLEPAPEVPDEPRTTPTSGGEGSGGEQALTLASPDVDDGGFLDPEFTCDGRNVPPELVIDHLPPGTAELAVAVVDLDADGFVHWVVAGLAPTTTRIEPGATPPDAVFARTGTGVFGWDGPCPPPDDDPHRYRFSLFATAEPIGMAPDLDGRDAIGVIEDAAIEEAHLTVRYARSAGG